MPEHITSRPAHAVETEFNGVDLLVRTGCDDLVGVIVRNPNTGAEFPAEEYYPDRCGPMAYLMIYRFLRSTVDDPDMNRLTRAYIENNRV